MGIFAYFIFYFIILFSIVGFGCLFKVIFLKKEKINLGYCVLYGIFILTILSYLANFFISINFYFNSLILFIGLILFTFFLLKEFIKVKKNILLFLIIFLVFFIFILTPKNHDDFPYYHFPYIHLLTISPINLGIGIFNYGFRTHSSIFYFSSLFFLPIAKYQLIHIAPVFFMGSVNFIFLKKIFYFIKIKTTQFSYILYLSILNLSFINIFFGRISEHGTDFSAQILILLIIVEILILIHVNNKKPSNDQFNRVYILIALAASLKSFYLIYLSFLIIVFYYQKSKIEFIFNLFKNKIIYCCLSLLALVLIVNFINSGCILYPISFSCNYNLIWTIKFEEVKLMSQWYELWSKAGATPNFRVTNPSDYIQNFNWIKNWINTYFFNHVFDFILGLSFLILSIFFILNSNKNTNKKKIDHNKYFGIYLLILLLFIEWFYKHPALRYGGYHLIALLVFIPFSFFLDKNILLDKKTILRIYLCILLIFIIFILRNTHRIYKQSTKYNYNPFIYSSFNKNFEDYHVYEQINKIKLCYSKNPDCAVDSIRLKKISDRYLFYREHKN
jgi:hypothetical protein